MSKKRWILTFLMGISAKVKAKDLGRIWTLLTIYTFHIIKHCILFHLPLFFLQIPFSLYSCVLCLFIDLIIFNLPFLIFSSFQSLAFTFYLFSLLQTMITHFFLSSSFCLSISFLISVFNIPFLFFDISLNGCMCSAVIISIENGSNFNQVCCICFQTSISLDRHESLSFFLHLEINSRTDWGL